MSRFVESTITFPYRRSLGPLLTTFMTALTQKRILGIRSGERVLVPPMEWDPATGADLGLDLIEVGPVGTVESWTWVPKPSAQHPLKHPFAFAFIRLDGATTPLLHAVDAGSPERGVGVGAHALDPAKDEVRLGRAPQHERRAHVEDEGAGGVEAGALAEVLPRAEGGTAEPRIEALGAGHGDALLGHAVQLHRLAFLGRIPHGDEVGEDPDHRLAREMVPAHDAEHGSKPERLGSHQVIELVGSEVDEWREEDDVRPQVATAADIAAPPAQRVCRCRSTFSTIQQVRVTRS